MLRRPGLLQAAAETRAASHPCRRHLRVHARGAAPPRTCQPLRGGKKKNPSRHRPAARTLPDRPPPPITNQLLSDWRRGAAPRRTSEQEHAPLAPLQPIARGLAARWRRLRVSGRRGGSGPGGVPVALLRTRLRSVGPEAPRSSPPPPP